MLHLLCTCFTARASPRAAIVVDGLFSSGEVEAMEQQLMYAPYTWGEGDFAGANPAGSVHELALTAPIVTQIVERVGELSSVFAAEGERWSEEADPDDFELYRAYVNKFMRSDHPLPHTDADFRDHVTLLYYANRVWKRRMGGETVFFDAAGEIGQSVLPRPGRIALFSGAVQHSARPPLPDVYWPRLTLALKWRRRTVGAAGAAAAAAGRAGGSRRVRVRMAGLAAGRAVAAKGGSLTEAGREAANAAKA